MADENEVLIKIATDISNAVQGLTAVTERMADVVESIANVGEQQEQAESTTKSFWETWISGTEQGTAASVAWGQQMSQAFDTLKEGIGNALKAFPQMIGDAADAGDEMFTLSNRTGVAVESLSELKYIAGQSGASFQGLTMTIQNMGILLTQTTPQAARAISQVGLSITELRKQKPEEAFFNILEAIKQTTPVAEQGTRAMEIFGGRFRANTMLLKEDIGALRQEFKELGGGMTTDLAEAGDAYNDALGKIQLVQENFRNQIASAVLPALNSMLDTMPMLGGAALTMGQGLLSAGESLLPMLGNIAMLKSSGIVSWFGTAAGGAGTLTTALGGLKAALAFIGPAAAVVATAFASWKIGEWIGNLKLFSGELQSMSEWVEYAGVKVMQFVGLSEKTSDADIKLAISSRRRAEETKNVAAATEQATAATTRQTSAFDVLSTKTKEIQAAYKNLTAAQKEQIKQAIAAGVSTSDIASILAQEMKIGADVATGAIGLFTKSLEKAKSTADASPFAKLMEEMKTLAKSMLDAAKAGAPMASQMEAFGKQAADAAKRAELIPGALAKLPPEVMKMANAFNAAELAKKVEEITKKAVELAKAFTEKVTKGAEAANAAVKKMTQEMELNMLSASQRRIRQIDFEEDAAIESIQRQADELDKALDEQITKIRANFAERRKAEEQHAAFGESVSAEKLAQIAAEEEAAIAAARSQVDATKKQYDEQTRVTRTYFDQKRALENKDTGNFEKDAELRGLKTKQSYAEQLRTQKETLDFMLRNREQFTDADIKKQEQAVEAAEVAAGKVKIDWQGALESITAAFEQLANIAGSTFGGIVKGVGEVIASVNVMQKGLSSAFGENGIGGIGKAFTQAKGAGGGFMGILKGVAGSIPAIGTAISGMMAAASAAVKIGKKVWDAFTKSGGEKMAKDVGRDFGVKISEEMGDAFYKTAKEKFRGDRFAASIYHLNDIINEAGGITEKNFDKMLGRLRDTFVMVETGKFKVEDATKVLDENFGAFAQHVLNSGKVASKQFQEIIALNARFGTQSKEVMDFVAGQTSRLGGALATLAGRQDQTNESMGRFERLAVAGFNAAIAAGVPYLDAIEQMGPALDKIVEHNKKLGREGGAAIQELLKFREVASANRELVEEAGALNEVMLALSNIGALNTETMADLQAQGAETFQKLTEAGFTEQQALQQMKGFLEQVRTAHEELGLPIDENTQKMIDQATANGVLKAQQMSTNDIMMQGLGAIIEALGGKMPEAFKKMADAGVDAAQQVRGTTDEATAALAEQAATLGATPWAQYAGRGVAAGNMAKGAMGGVSGAVSGVQGELSSTDWSGWSEEAVAAANEAQAAIDSVSFGSSPGGIKEIPLKLAEAMKSFKQFEKMGVGSAEQVRAAMDAMSAQAGAVGAGVAENAKIGAAASVDQRMPMQGGSNVSVQIQTIDSSNMEAAVQNKILPGIIKTLRTGGRGLGDMQGVLR